MRHISFRTRLTLVAATAVGVAIALASAASYFVVRHQLFTEVDDQLHRQALTIARTPGRLPLTGPQGVRVRPFAGRFSNEVFQVVHADGTVDAVSDAGQPLALIPRDLAVAAGQGGQYLREGTAQGTNAGHYRILTMPASPGIALQLARPLDDIDHSLARLRLALLAVALAGVALAGGLGWIVARAALRPVGHLTAATEHVATTQDLGAVIDEGRNDELGRLARSFNAMLAALRISRREQAQLISDASHELRTPLTSLRTNIEVLLKARRLSDVDRRALLADVTGQLEEMTTLVGDLVELSRGEEQDSEPEDLAFGDVVDRALERARRRAPSVTFDAQLSPVTVHGQPGLLERAVLNVLDNAAKWSPPGGHVEVSLARNGDNTSALDVRDYGPGIPADDLPKVFDRFYRAPAARALPGSGLGLAIVRQVVQEHRGTVSATSPPDGGTLVRICLPVVDVSDGPTAYLRQG